MNSSKRVKKDVDYTVFSLKKPFGATFLAPLLTFKEYIKKNPPKLRQVGKVGAYLFLVVLPGVIITEKYKERVSSHKRAQLEGNKLLAARGEKIVDDPRWS